MTLPRTTTLLLILLASPAAGQSLSPTPSPGEDQRSSPPPRREVHFSVRGVGLFAVQGFSAQETFKGIFDSTAGPFWGGGAQIVFGNGFYGEVNVTRFHKDGQRAFLANGEPMRLGFPLSATITPVEVTGGYRFQLRKHPSLIPYLGAGVGSYGYKETSDGEDDFDSRHVGYLAVGGVEYRVHRLIGFAVDIQYTHIPGIIGSGGISEQAGENDLGGTAARFRIVFGR
jgi:hypothetical protein